MQAKALINNLIIGGIEEDKIVIETLTLEAQEMDKTMKEDDTPQAALTGQMHARQRLQTTEESVAEFLKEDLKIPVDELKNINIVRCERIGLKRVGKNRNIVIEFKSVSDKEKVKSYRKLLQNTGKYMHDQYPPEIVALRRKLVPIMKKAKDDNKTAYIKYNKLYVDGEVYVSGPYGDTPQ